MRLLDLDPQFIRREIRACFVGSPECNTVSPHTEHEYHIPAELNDADGIMFLCPVCFTANGGNVGTHCIICWRPRVPADIAPKPGRWEFFGTGLHDLSLRADSSSILLMDSPCKAHFFITDGQIS